jgi:dynein heavy chain 2
MKFDPEVWTSGLTNVIKVWKSVYKQLADSGIPKIKEEDMLTEDPIVNLILGEIKGSLGMVKRIADKFKKLFAVLKGESPLEKDVEEFGLLLLAGKIPNDWENQLPDLNSPTEWLQIFIKKLLAMKGWQESVSDLLTLG